MIWLSEIPFGFVRIVPFANDILPNYDVAIVGSGFASSFFLLGYLPRAPRNAKIVVLERGSLKDTTATMEERKAPSSTYVSANSTSDIPFRQTGDPGKAWMFSLGFGGGSKCWWGNTPRFLPADFETRSRFGVGRDWPFGYDELSPYYDRVETAMSIAGPTGPWPFPRNGPYPQPPHRMNDAERMLAAAWPESFFTVPCARSRIAIPDRNVCCGNGICSNCPVDAKFTVRNGLAGVYDDPRVTVLGEAEVIAIETVNKVARSVLFRLGGKEQSVSAELVVLGANALFNPIILQRSSLNHAVLGKGLHEQVGLVAEVFLDGIDCFQGSTSVTGHSYQLYTDDERRKKMAACLVETWNVGNLRAEPGRWQQVLPVRLVYEDLPEPRNHVAFDAENPDEPLLHYEGHSDYTARALERAEEDLARVVAPLPVESIAVRPRPEATEAHILGTTPMGNDPSDSIVDSNSIHHEVHNLVVLGGGTFPASGPSNPTLTLSALALRAAERLTGLPT